MIDIEELEKRFDQKLEEFRVELPKKYTEGKIVSQNCAMLTMRGFLEIIGKEDENYINMSAPLAALTDTCGAVNAGLMITGLISCLLAATFYSVTISTVPGLSGLSAR